MTIDHMAAGPPAAPVRADWGTITGTSRTTLTTHLWTAPPLRRGSPIHDKAFDALRELRADHARFLTWFSHPRLAVPELTPPTDTGTSWDFELLDPFVEDFMAAAEGRPVVANFATIPTWMFVTPEPVAVPEDPDEIQWDYEQGSEFRDPTLTEVADYFYRIASWYIAGGFTDEHGVRHESGYHYRFAYWEVLCEPNFGHNIPPEVYTRLYDAVVERLRPLDPEMQFIGLSLAPVPPEPGYSSGSEPEYFWSFLDPANHADRRQPDAFSYHLYATPQILNPFSEAGNSPPAHWRDSFFAQADEFLNRVHLIESIRRRLAPDTKTFINELGTFNPDLMNPAPNLPQEYWGLSSSIQSYLWAKLVAFGVDLVGIAEFMDYPGMIPGLTLIDWETGTPNTRYRALALLLRHFAPGDALVATSAGMPGAPDPRVHAQGFTTTDGTRKLLLVNKTAAPVTVTLPDGARQLHQVSATSDGTTATTLTAGDLTLDAYATAVVTF